MTQWNDFDVDNGQSHWSGWTTRPAKRAISTMNYVSGFLFALTLIVVVMGMVG